MYSYFSLEFYDQENGIRGGGGLGVLAADTRRVAEEMGVDFVAVTPFYPSESFQKMENGRVVDGHRAADYHDFGYQYLDYVFIKCDGNLCKLEVITKKLGSTRILCVTEPNFGELYAGASGSDHRLYQEVALGFGGYQALKMLGIKVRALHLNEVPTFFAGLARLDDLISGGMDLYEAFVKVRKHTLYTNHTLVQAAEAEFMRQQFERFVYPNLKSVELKHWLNTQFVNDKIKLSKAIFEIAGKRNGVSKLHASLAKYTDAAGEKIVFEPITNGIDFNKWVSPVVLENYESGIAEFTAEKIRELKTIGREILNEILATRPDQNGKILHFEKDDFIFDFKRRFVDYKRPELPFKNPARLREILESRDAHYILSGRIHTGDKRMEEKFYQIMDTIKNDDYLNTHMHFIPDYDEKIAYGLSCGSNATINVPIVGLEACGTSWMKDVANLNLLISTPDGGVADVEKEAYLYIDGKNENEELEQLYARMEEAILAWDNDFELEFLVQKQLEKFLPLISGRRMFKKYLDFLEIP